MIRRIPPTHSAPDHAPYNYDDPRNTPAQVEEGWGSTPRVPDREYLIKRDAKFDAQTILGLIGLAEGSRAPVGGDWDDGSRLPVPEPWSLIPGRGQRGGEDEGCRDLAADSIGVMLRKRLYDGKVSVSSVDVLGPAFKHIAAGDSIISVNATPADKVTLERIVSIVNGPQGSTVMSHCVVEVGDLQGGGLRSLVFARRPLPLPTPASYPGFPEEEPNQPHAGNIDDPQATDVLDREALVPQPSSQEDRYSHIAPPPQPHSSPPRPADVHDAARAESMKRTPNAPARPSLAQFHPKRVDDQHLSSRDRRAVHLSSVISSYTAPPPQSWLRPEGHESKQVPFFSGLFDQWAGIREVSPKGGTVGSYARQKPPPSRRADSSSWASVPAGQVVIKIQQACNIPINDAFFTPETYVRVKFPGCSFKTRTIKGLHPVWNETAVVPLTMQDAGEDIRVVVCGWVALGADETVGTVNISIKELANLPLIPGVGRLRKTQGWFLLRPGEESCTPLFEVSGSVSQALMLEITYEEVEYQEQAVLETERTEQYC